MPRPKGSKNKPKTDAVKPAKKAPAKTVKPTKALKKAVDKGTVKVAPVVAKAVKESKPLPVAAPVVAPAVKPKKSVIKALEEAVAADVKKVEAVFVKPKTEPATPVNAPVLEPEAPAAVSQKTKAVAGKNEGEAVIRPVDDDEDDNGGGNTVVMQGGKPTLRKSRSNPDLD
jgi:hypothetical protein